MSDCSSSSSSSSLESRLEHLQSRFTWDLKEEDMDLVNLSTRLQEHIELQLGERGAVARSYGFLAYVRYLQGKPEEALSLLNQSEEKTLESYGEDSERRLIVTYGDMAWLKYHTGDYAQSRSYSQRVEDILMKYPTTSSTDLHPEVLGEKGWTYLKFSKPYYPRAIDCFCEAVKLQPKDREWNAGYAIALYRTEKRVTKTSEHEEESPAMKQLRRALEINPSDGVLQSMLALKLADYQQHQEADRLVESALEVDPDNPHVTRYIAMYFRNQGKIDRSIDLLKRALKRSSQSAFIHHQLALCYLNKKKKKYEPFNSENVQQWRRLSIQHLEEAVKIKPSFYIALADLAQLCGEEGDLTRAETLFQQGLQMTSKLEKSLSQVFHFRYAKFHHYQTKNEAEAISHYTKGLLLTPETRERRQCAEKLREIAQRRLKDEAEDDGGSFALLAVVAKAEGDIKKAAEFYEKALDCDENDEYLSALCELRMKLD